ncbi:MAG: aminodeoxychorismate synthase component I [Bacteroidetes bacterium HGW-Bacteroidetes-2]|nr:MAG: aminodeoxychorismate synthase component I [Bacteroidetes bacterium HGW-Bacteroidetes-2]
MRVVKQIELDQPEPFKRQLLHWAQQFEEVLWLDSNAKSNGDSQTYSSYDVMLAIDAFTSIKTDWHNAFKKLEEYQKKSNDWLFGYLTYDLKNDVENLTSNNHDQLHFADLCFFQPKKIFLIQGNRLEVQYLNFVSDEIEADIQAIKNSSFQILKENSTSKIVIKARTSEAAYLEKVDTMLKHIHKGDVYEANFCQEFYAENARINPLDVFEKLNSLSKAPFTTFLRLENQFLLSASPERYIKKEGTKVISQPIKGTMRRSKEALEDKKLAVALCKDIKERSENIMITDLVRNDLSRTAAKGSVAVEELCGLYSFLQVHQLISTITSEVSKEMEPVEILRTTFPMGSMTGAPKVSAMHIIETLEDAKRGLYSGTVGYFTPEGDFDFNVVIRSILYNAANRYISFSVGSAITAQSIPEKEFEECLLKAKAMREVLS